jgi:LuxR family maltose regulon positive regulatory protein
MHARRFRVETCRELCAQIDAELADPASPQGPMWRRSVELLRELARGHAAIAAQAWRQALEPLGRADALVMQLQQGRLHIELLGLRAYALDRCGERSLPLLREAIDLAQAYGLRRVFADAHPALGDWVRQVRADDGAPGAGGAPLRAPMRQAPAAEPARPRSSPSMALTPKEREVLALLANSLSNKEIGLAMQVGEETIKWHVKNLLAKLDAGNRKQVVSRARVLGLLETS